MFICIIACLSIGTFAVTAASSLAWTHDPHVTACTPYTTGHTHADMEYAYATTTCYSVDGETGKSTAHYHYTRARGEQRLFGKTISVAGDSDRVYGTGRSYAESDCYHEDLTGCTYYGV